MRIAQSSRLAGIADGLFFDPWRLVDLCYRDIRRMARLSLDFWMFTNSLSVWNCYDARVPSLASFSRPGTRGPTIPATPARKVISYFKICF